MAELKVVGTLARPELTFVNAFSNSLVGQRLQDFASYILELMIKCINKIINFSLGLVNLDDASDCLPAVGMRTYSPKPNIMRADVARYLF